MSGVYRFAGVVSSLIGVLVVYKAWSIGKPYLAAALLLETLASAAFHAAENGWIHVFPGLRIDRTGLGQPHSALQDKHQWLLALDQIGLVLCVYLLYRECWAGIRRLGRRWPAIAVAVAGAISFLVSVFTGGQLYTDTHTVWHIACIGLVWAVLRECK